MYSYPLRFKTEATPADADLTVLDAEKNEILFRPQISETMQNGKAPCIIFTDKTSRQPIYTTRLQKKNGVQSYTIHTPGEALLGEVVSGPAHAWQVLDAGGNQLASIQEKAAWKNSCLFMILTFPFDSSDTDAFLKLLAPHRYLVKLNGKKVLELRELASTIHDDYGLKKKGEFSEREEALLLVSLITVLGLKE